MEELTYKEKRVRVVPRPTHDGGYEYVVVIDGMLISRKGVEELRYPTAQAACQAGLQYAMATIDGTLKPHT